MQDALSCLLVLAGGDDHARIRDSDADAGDDLGKCIVIDTVVKVLGIDVIRVFQPWYTDRVGTDAESCLKVLCVHQESCKFIAVFVQSEEYA